MSDEESGKKRPRLPRREFLSNSAKLLTGAAAPLILAPKSCDDKQKDCEPSAGGAAAHSDRPAGRPYDVIVIGSGFGATVAVTSLLARKPDLNVLILERGLWWLSPDRPKPDYLAANPAERAQYYVRPDHNDGVRYLLSILSLNGARPLSKADPLYHLHTFGDINVLSASGVGGGSLIYLNVTIPPIKDESGAYPVMKDWALRLTETDYRAAHDWMAKWRGRLNNIVTEFPLRPGLDPADLGDRENLYLSKTRAFRHAANVTGDWRRLSPWTPAPLSIDEYDESNPDVAGKHELEVCTRLGRCFLGCTPRAIQTLDKTLLNRFLNDRRKYPGLSLESLREVSHVQQASDGTYNVYFRDRNSGREDDLRAYNARQVVIAAGTLGSNEILLRSRNCEKTLSLSERLGHGFSGNGDLGGFIMEVGQHYPPGTSEKDKVRYRVYPTRGPLITSYVQFEADGGPGVGPVQMTVEDGGIPPTVAALTKFLLNLTDRPTSAHDIAAVYNKLRELGDIGLLPKLAPKPADPQSYQTEQEMLENVFYFQCMGRDEPDGQFLLDRKGRLDLTFNGKQPKEHPVYKKLEEIMRAMAVRMGGRFVRFPSLMPNPRLFTLHPLGGCPVGADATRGVVDERGRVFKGGGDPKAVYEGLYVMDASIFPGPVAVNPTLTIVALALRIAENIRV